MATATFTIRPITIEDGMAIASWRYPGPWVVYDCLERPPADESFWAVDLANGELAGFCAVGAHARVPGLDEAPQTLDVTFGLAPDLRGRGLGLELAAAVVDHARKVAAGRRLRCIVNEENGSGRRAAESAGFVTVGEHELGDNRYLIYADA